MGSAKREKVGGGCVEAPPGAGTHLELEAAQHDEEDEGEAGEADGQADQALEEEALPRWVVKLLRAGHGADSLNTLIFFLGGTAACDPSAALWGGPSSDPQEQPQTSPWCQFSAPTPVP